MSHWESASWNSSASCCSIQTRAEGLGVWIQRVVPSKLVARQGSIQSWKVRSGSLEASPFRMPSQIVCGSFAAMENTALISGESAGNRGAHPSTGRGRARLLVAGKVL